MKKTTASKIGLVFCMALAGVLSGCSHTDHPHHHAHVYSPPPPVYADAGVVVHGGYIYYPSYQVYYSSSRRQYIYRDGRSWVTRSAPPRVSVDVLVASPSVRLDFDDAPEIHHARVVKQYPKHWKPPQSHRNHDQQKGY